MADDLAKKHNELLAKLEETKAEGGDDDGEDETDRLLSHAIEVAIQQGKGWTAAEREEYLKKIVDDDYIPPLFASTQEELEKSGLAEAFSSLIYDQSPTQSYLEFKKKGNDAFTNGQRNEASNVQYFRDAINHYYEALAWANRIQSSSAMDASDVAAKDSRFPDDPLYNDTELDEIKSTLCANAALAHMQLRNWGHARDDSNKASSCADDVLWSSSWSRVRSLSLSHEYCSLRFPFCIYRHWHSIRTISRRGIDWQNRIKCFSTMKRRGMPSTKVWRLMLTIVN